jgi:DNA helicase-4
MPNSLLMKPRKRIRKNGKPGRLKGIKVPRQLKFEPSIVTRSGTRVRSKYEQTCANWLARHHIEFEYEPLMLLEGRQFRPDFYLPGYDLFIEICGYNHMPYYVEHYDRKKQLYAKFGLNVIFIDYDGKGSLGKLLESELKKRGIKIRDK